ncbi:MAG: dihydropteroate synthase [Dysgonamonadaceae bacterium]|jgi:dihydropteroate synthase|nr:dihydropteroate synthase [Dysgonamonadaceae bacterium]
MYINIKGELVDLSFPRVMGILNLTPDSFYPRSRKQTEQEIATRVNQLQAEGADFIDVGAFSTRPGAALVTEEEETARLDFGLGILFREYPKAVVSVDTFRSEIALRCVEKYGVAMINDISAGEMDDRMHTVVAQLKVPYILMHLRGGALTMMQDTVYADLMKELFLYFSEKINALHLSGVTDIILDPGFGFSKNTEQNFLLMRELKEFRLFDLPLLVGISRKTMIREALNCSVEESLNGTTVLNTFALLNGASILRVHDVKEAVESIRLLEKLH